MVKLVCSFHEKAHRGIVLCNFVRKENKIYPWIAWIPPTR